MKTCMSELARANVISGLHTELLSDMTRCRITGQHDMFLQIQINDEKKQEHKWLLTGYSL